MPAPASEPGARDRRFLWFPLIGSVFAGLGLRLWNLLGQVLGGDELHAVRAAVTRTVPGILTNYGMADSSLPLTALYRWLLDQGATLSELAFRAPAIVCGALALVLFPYALAGRVPRPAVLLFAWFGAISPSLVLYSRIARSYLPMVLCAVLAVLAFETWWRTRTWKWGGVYVVFGALAVWLHLGAAPFVAAPFLFALGDLSTRRGERWGRLRDLAVLGLAFALACSSFLLPARASLERLVARKSVAQSIPLATVWDVLRLQAGTASHTVAVLFWIVALAGLVLLLRDRPRFGAFTLTVVAGHLLGLLLLSPVGMAHPLVLNRYLLPVLPFVLLWEAHALGRLWTRKAGGCTGFVAQRYATRLFLLLLFWTGPFLSPGYRDGSFMHHNDFVVFVRPRATLPDGLVPAVYRDLPRGPVLEAPWPTVWDHGRVFYVYQRIHDHRVLVSAPFDLPRVPGIELRNEVPPEPRAILASPARTLIIHLRLPWEEDRVETPGRSRNRRMPADVRQSYRRAGERLAARLAAAWGPPDRVDGFVRVWDLERVRKAAGDAR
jgi:Dolichyl-phosphate-mannose-protein mannosyltransferase